MENTKVRIKRNKKDKRDDIESIIRSAEHAIRKAEKDIHDGKRDIKKSRIDIKVYKNSKEIEKRERKQEREQEQEREMESNSNKEEVKDKSVEIDTKNTKETKDNAATTKNKRVIKYVLLVVMCDCGQQDNFKNNIYPEIKKELKNSKDAEFKIVKVLVPNHEDDVTDEDIHPKLLRLINWFPYIFLTKKTVWYDHNSDITGAAFNGEMENGKLVHRETLPYTSKAILGWITHQITNEPYFKS